MVKLSPTPSCVLLLLFVQSEETRKKCQRKFVLADTFMTEPRRPMCAGRFYDYYERLTRHTEPLLPKRVNKKKRNKFAIRWSCKCVHPFWHLLRFVIRIVLWPQNNCRPIVIICWWAFFAEEKSLRTVIPGSILCFKGFVGVVWGSVYIVHGFVLICDCFASIEIHRKWLAQGCKPKVTS